MRSTSTRIVASAITALIVILIACAATWSAPQVVVTSDSVSRENRAELARELKASTPKNMRLVVIMEDRVVDATKLADATPRAGRTP
jgi:hypothetical protein